MLTEAQREQLVQGAESWGLSLEAEVVAKFERFAELLEAGNQRLNLTRIPMEEIVTLHFLDSLALAAVLSPPPGARLLDLGTGGGFPGLPLALAFPKLQVTLVDSTQKRLTFLEEVLADLGLSGSVRTVHGRAEDLARLPLHREVYHIVTARAVAKMDVLAPWMLPFVRPGGIAVAYKSREATLEIEAARPKIGNSGGILERVEDIPLPGTDIHRKLAILKKTHRGRL